MALLMKGESMPSAVLSKQLVAVIDALEPGETLEHKVMQLVGHELRRRLARYQLVDRLFRDKYGMSLVEFEAAEMVKQLGYSFEAESDHQDWDLAVDGIQSIQRQLTELQRTA
jgi:hypothetical protein